jgi:SAM-dependent methyltransferase
MSVEWWQTHLYRDPLSRDPALTFVRVLECHVRPSYEVLDLGAGSGCKNIYAFKGQVKRIDGVDLDARVRDNPLLDNGVLADVNQLPYEDNSFDLAFAIYLLEHLEHPDAFVKEVRRVLRPEGLFLALTPNRWHYVSVVSACTPVGFHRWFNKRRGRHEQDTFPTFYRMNSRRALKRLFEPAGFEVLQLSMVESQPNYLTFCTPAFLVGAVYERLVNSTEWLSPFRVNIVGVFQNGPKGNAYAPERRR